MVAKVGRTVRPSLAPGGGPVCLRIGLRVRDLEVGAPVGAGMDTVTEPGAWGFVMLLVMTGRCNPELAAAELRQSASIIATGPALAYRQIADRLDRGEIDCLAAWKATGEVWREAQVR